jgi:hypothetical protein
LETKQARLGVITSIKIIKNNTFFILETFGNFLETDLLVSGLTVSNGSFKDNVSLSWDAVSGVDGYKIFKNNTQEIATTTNTFFQDNIQQPGKLANYSVKTFVYLDGLEYRSKPVTLSGWRKIIRTNNILYNTNVSSRNTNQLVICRRSNRI